ncbi:DUF1572 family protein [Psychroserpens sp. NJDZ02]|uniref:DUF1572 family protein n=1 Tax=Psychroserpens sp. NJDZ02 TaxID=2570561 RepID=UPI0010A8B841|nr:DUF1572 family protein [Psychroserpens sp. NJDZ02]QCE42647.1 DUF1572 domain-containing protein [Psychroserpens sp. NJDZ02]
MNSHITSLIKQFDYYKTAGDKTLQQLSFDDLNWQSHNNSNSVSIIVKHMVGNMLSRWTNFLTEDGEKNWRQREQEFEATYTTKDQLIADWNKGWQCVYDAIKPLKNEDLERTVYIRNESHTVADAIFRQLGHYSYHIGQIAYIGVSLKNNDWQSLSIPKGQSVQFNSEKFSKPKT